MGSEYEILTSQSWLQYSVLLAAIVFIIGKLIAHYCRRATKKGDAASTAPPEPVSVNYHFTRQCNYQCGFCFHTAKTSFVLPIVEAKRGLKLLKEAGNVVYVSTLLYVCIYEFFKVVLEVVLLLLQY